MDEHDRDNEHGSAEVNLRSQPDRVLPEPSWVHVAQEGVRTVREALDSWARTARLSTLLAVLGATAGLLLMFWYAFSPV